MSADPTPAPTPDESPESPEAPAESPEAPAESAEAPPAASVALSYWLILWLSAAIMLVTFKAPAVRLADGRALGSFAALLALIFGAAALLDGRLRARSRPRFLLSGAGALFALYLALNTWLLSVTSASAGSLLRHLFSAESTRRHLEEAGIEPWVVALGACGLLGALFLGGLLHARFSRLNCSRRGVGVLVALWLATGTFFVAEQSQQPPGYYSRTKSLPAYLQLFSSGVEPAEVLARPRPPLPTPRKPAGQAPHVLLIVLESMRAELLDRPELVPNLRALAERSLECRRGYTEATDTHLSWQTLFLERPAFERLGDPGAEGSPALALFKQAGYQLVLVASTTIDWYRFDERLRGSREDFFQRCLSFDQARGPGFRHQADQQATDALLESIQALDETPTLLVLQLDATHFAYDFDPERAVVRPHMQAIEFGRLHYSQEALDLLEARYLNAANQVDLQIGRVLDALKARGLSERTAVVVVSDHGEEFVLGRVGHATVSPETKRVPLLVSLPGVPGRRLERPAALADVWPTLSEHLELGLPSGAWRGRSLLDPNPVPRAILSYSSLSQRAHLTRPTGAVIEFHAERLGSTRLLLHPIGLVDADGARVVEWPAVLTGDPSWRQELAAAVR